MLSITSHSEHMFDEVRQFKARVALYDGATLIKTYNYTDALKEFTVERVAEQGKFFGFGVCHKVNIKLLDKDRSINVQAGNNFKIGMSSTTSYTAPFPLVYVSEVHRNENTGELSITAYDILHKANKLTIAELGLGTSYTIKSLIMAYTDYLGTGLVLSGFSDKTCFDLSFPDGANFEGTETIKEALDAAAEATQSIYYLNWNNQLVFRRLSKDGAAVLTIDKSKYFELDSKTNRRLATICHATELGDNVSASIAESGTTQYIRNNPFWELRDDIGTLVDNALAAVGGMTINQFECKWRGNYLLEIGDKIALETKEGELITSYVFDDVITYNGALEAITQWSYEDNDEETASNPTTLGEALKQTYARVDKANKQIDIIASEIGESKENISSLQINTNSISASVSAIEKNTSNTINTLTEDIANLTNKVEASMTSEQVKLEIKKELENGVTKVETNTGFTFNDEGLTIEKSGSEMKTTITEDGMTVYKDNEAVLTANNVGVDAVNLHATTYLIIGNNSRFEDYLDNRTACFWIGN